MLADFRLRENALGAERAFALHALLGRIPHDFRRTAVRNLERAGVSRSVAMQLTGHKTENAYRRYAIVAEQDLRDGVAKLASLHANVKQTASSRTGLTGKRTA